MCAASSAEPVKGETAENVGGLKIVVVVIVVTAVLCVGHRIEWQIVNEFKMRSDIRSFNLAGMGCSASLISVDLVKVSEFAAAGAPAGLRTHTRTDGHAHAHGRARTRTRMGTHTHMDG